MCGIIGGVTNTDITPLLLDGLNRLEYRGYDSSGLVLLTKNNKLSRERALGKVINLEKKLKLKKTKIKGSNWISAYSMGYSWRAIRQKCASSHFQKFN